MTVIESKACIKNKGKIFDSLYSKLESEVTTSREMNMLQESYRAFYAVDNQKDTRIVDMINGDVVTDLEFDHPKALLEHSIILDRVKKFITNCRKSIKRQKQRWVATLLDKRLFSCMSCMNEDQ